MKFMNIVKSIEYGWLVRYINREWEYGRVW
jgi:hypothetical protein